MILKLCNDHLGAIRAHAESTYPEECCGLLIGKMSKDSKTVVEVMACVNVWNTDSAESFPGSDAIAKLDATKRTQYTIAPEVMFKAQRIARDRQLDIIGIYHSHPNHSAIPSEFDRMYAWHQYSYIIVSVQNGQACELNSWSLDDDHQFQSEAIITIEQT